jgi:hypothetical protein
LIKNDGWEPFVEMKKRMRTKIWMMMRKRRAKNEKII